MFTLNQVIKRLQTIALNHAQLNPLIQTEPTFSHFGFGDLWDEGEILTDAGTVITERFPLVWANVQSANVTSLGAQANGLVTISMQLLFMDLVHKDTTNQNDVLSDTLQIATDFITELQDDTEFQTYHYTVDINGTLEPFTERFDEEVSGWSLNITFNIPYSANCLVVPQTSIIS